MNDKVYILQNFLPLCLCRKLRLYLETPSAWALKAYYPNAELIVDEEVKDYFTKDWWCWRNARKFILWPVCLREHRWHYPGWINEGQTCKDCGVDKDDTPPNQLCPYRCTHCPPRLPQLAPIYPN